MIAGFLPAVAFAQVPARTARVGFLTHGPSDGPRWLFDPIAERLRALGWVEGRNLVSEYRYADRKAERLEALARDLVASRVEVIVAMQTVSAHAAKAATRDIPIVFATSDLNGLVDNMARPEGNLTGVSNHGAAIAGKQVEIVKAIAPKAALVVALANPANPSTPAFERDAQAAAKILGLRFAVVRQRDPADIARHIQAMTRRPDALLVQNDAFFFSEMTGMIALASSLRVPAVYGAREFAVDGGLASYGANLPAIYLQLATYIDRILRGAKPRDLPVTQPTKYELVINAKSARGLGLELPAALMLRADEIIE